MKRRLTAVAAVIWALVLVAVASSTITMMATGGVGNASGRAITDEEQAILDRYSRLEDVRKTITDQYYEEVDQDTLVQGAIDGMLASLDDPYTFYYTVDDMAAREESTYGNYKGVGMSVQMDGEGAINVVRVFANSPAEKAGVLSGDKLIAIDGVTLNIQNYKDLDEAVDMIRGVADTEVTLSFLRNGEPLELQVTRGDVQINYVEYQLIDDIGYVRIYEFESTTAQDFIKALDYF